MSTSQICQMCEKSAELKQSHIFPRSYFRKLKSGNGQLMEVVVDDNTKPRKSNLDPKEELFCEDCEQYLSKEFENYGTRILTNHKIAKVTNTYVEFSTFRFKEFYLYLISIIWRASISSLDTFDQVNLPDELNNLFKYCLKNKTIKINTSLRLDHFVRVSVLRVVDTSNQLDDIIIKKTMMNINFERGKNKEEGMMYYFMIDGFLITYHFNIESDIHKVRTEKSFAQLRNLPKLKIPKVDMSNLSQISTAFSTVTNKIIEHSA